MNFTPRSVAMGNSMNKAYKLHVKFESGKETFSCLPDTSVGQLKGKIGARFQVPPSQLVLFCNGKLLQGDDYQTLRQARVCSGSKILANRVGAGRPSTDSQQDSSIEVDHEEERRREEIRSEREAKEREAELVSRLSKVEEEGEQLGQEVARLAAASRQELSVRRRESKMAGEQLMRLLETLDGISLGQEMFELRARRKKAAARINSLMDTNDANIQAIDEAAKYQKS